jgi:hypothetical protein
MRECVSRFAVGEPWIVEFQRGRKNATLPGMTRSANWELDLYEFLVSAFTPDGLRRWVYFNCRPAADGLPGAPADVQTVAFQFVTEAGKLGLLDDDFFERLAAERDVRRGEVEAIRGRRPAMRVAVHRGASPIAVKPGAGLEPSHTAITLDRMGQWDGILNRCADPEHLLVLVHGDREQDVHLFLRRIKTYVDKECPRRHHEYIVEIGRDHSAAVTADDWARQVCLASPLQIPNLEGALGQAARSMAALFVLEDAGRPLRNLDGEHFAGFAEFFAHRLPRALAVAPPANPVRFVLPVEHADDGQAVREALDQLALRVERVGGLRVLPAEELRFPTLSEVCEQLYGDYPDLDAVTWAACERVYDEVTDRTKRFRRTLQDLADPIHRILVEFAAQQSASRLRRKF